jgi:hemolysin III
MIKKRYPHDFGSFLVRTVSCQIHFFGIVVAALGLRFMLSTSKYDVGSPQFFSILAFGLTSILVFATSTIYHLLHDGFQINTKLEHILENLDHVAIYLFIAGSYTPFLLEAVTKPWSDILLWTVWTIAVLGILYTWTKTKLPKWAQHRFVYTGLFVIMGWLLLFRISEIIQTLPTRPLFFLMLGAVAYTIGALVYAFKKPNFSKSLFGFHELWHSLVLAGFVCHFFSISLLMSKTTESFPTQALVLHSSHTAGMIPAPGRFMENKNSHPNDTQNENEKPKELDRTNWNRGKAVTDKKDSVNSKVIPPNVIKPSF